MAHLGNTIVNGALRVLGGEYVDSINTGSSLTTGALEVKGIIAGDSGSTGHGLQSGGGYHNAYNNILLHGDSSTATSGIAFMSDKVDSSGTVTNVNQPSDRAFIQYHACGITTATAEGTNPTLATSGENGRLVIGIGNDATDQVWLQTPGRTGLIHQVGNTSYVIPDTNNTTGSVGSASQPSYVEGGVIKACTYSLNKTVPSDAVFTDNDTKNTAGSTDSSSKLFLIGATSQAANPQTYSHDTAYVGTDGCLYSGGTKVLTAHQDISGKLNKSGDTMTGRLTTAKPINQIITGSGTTAQDKGSGVSPRYFPAKWTFNTGQTVTNGDIITIKIPCAGHDYGVFISIDNGATYKPVSISGTSRLATHYGNASYLTLIYKSDGQTNNVYAAAGADARSNVTGGCWLVCNYYDTGNTYDRNRYNAAIKAWGTKIIAGNIIVGINGLYHHLKEGTAFDITYPILYLNGDCNASATTTNTYDILNFTITTTQSITLTAYKPVYIKGTLSGTTFTPDSTTPLTQTVPTSADGKYYMFLGNATSTTAVYLTERHEIYAYKNGAFGRIVNDALSVNGYTVAKSVPSNAVFTDNNNAVTQTATTTSADYEVLFSATADNTTRTEGARKNSNLKFNPSTGNLTVTKVNGESVKYSSSVSAVVGDTTCTISDSSITTTSLIEPFSSNSTGDTIAIKNIAVTAGQAVLTFKALAVDTSFRLRITNV